MRKIFGIGETVYDIIFKDGSPQAAKPGGSVLNAMVSLGRTGLPVSFTGEYGLDDIGCLIDDFLKENGVDTSLVYRYADANTSLAIAFLNENNDAHYTFYKEKPGKRLDTVFPTTTGDDILLFGSYFAVAPDVREKLLGFIRGAAEAGTLIIYDPNFRSAHLQELGHLKPYILENMKLASLVRGSDEDFHNISGARNAEEAWGFVREHCSCLVYTASSKGVSVRTKSFSGEFPVKKIKPVSTIGAGDNFNAGMATAIYNNGITRDDLSKMGEEQWKKIVGAGVDFASEVCLSYENYISFAFAKRYFSASNDHI
ncbi:MAG: PfkB family carbohydrate kinase [Bacteroidales bacterium]|jgi:fructokinase|nr:PfkB family carbohydrate kinase [Bacteroidales bacterium]